MTLIRIVALIGLLSASAALGGATVSIQGKLWSVTESEYMIQTKKSIYHIARNALPAEQTKKLERPETEVSLTVPMEAIVQVRPVKAPAANQVKR